jgi:hypothetical protein
VAGRIQHQRIFQHDFIAGNDTTSNAGVEVFSQTFLRIHDDTVGPSPLADLVLLLDGLVLGGSVAFFDESIIILDNWTVV